MSTHRLDTQALYTLLADRLDLHGLTWQDLARETGMSQSTYTRLAEGRAPNAHGLLTLLVWLGRSASVDMIITRKENPDA